ncbi:lactonohydrolase [Patellaria atrata CBS 101060]|uniref:Lactonohydrolase n=1 Tax=Patellaria atrata CBS 101060 TaxID=1346257 RepID=A0A9P4SC42_9PEZI|nr:lactonohydrolase [Patellaria atrata CBS 101060]
MMLTRHNLSTHALHFLTFSVSAIAQLAAPCPGLPTASTVCINRHASVMPYPFFRFHPSDGSLSPEDSFPRTNTTDPTFALVRNATFLVFDHARAADILGPDPILEHLFDLPPGFVHEAPVYVPSINSVIFSALAQDVVPQLIINLDGPRPTIANYTPEPPVYGVNGGRYHDGKIYWAVSAGVPFPHPEDGSTVLQTPGIVELDPTTNATRTLLNNYYGAQFNSPDDVVVASNGDIFFTDPWYGWSGNLTAAPVLPAATWRFRPATGQAQIVESSLVQPNGIALSPDEKTIYITDTGLTEFDMPEHVLPRFSLNSTGPRYLYAFDLDLEGKGGRVLTEKRVVFLAAEFGTDGVHVAADGSIVGAIRERVDVLSPEGELILQIRSTFVVNNVQFVGPDLDELWLFGYGGVSRVKWNLKGRLEGRASS